MNPASSAPGRAAGTETATSNHDSPARQAHQPSGIARVGEERLGHSTGDAVLLNRVGRVIHDLSAAREVSDAEIRQHAADCTYLMDLAYARFEETGNPADREEAVLWMHRRDEAHRSMSPAWKAAREAQIQRQTAGAGYFVDEGDAARARLNGGSQ